MNIPQLFPCSELLHIVSSILLGLLDFRIKWTQLISNGALNFIVQAFSDSSDKHDIWLLLGIWIESADYGRLWRGTCSYRPPLLVVLSRPVRSVSLLAIFQMKHEKSSRWALMAITWNTRAVYLFEAAPYCTLAAFWEWKPLWKMFVLDWKASDFKPKLLCFEYMTRSVSI